MKTVVVDLHCVSEACCTWRLADQGCPAAAAAGWPPVAGTEEEGLLVVAVPPHRGRDQYVDTASRDSNRKYRGISHFCGEDGNLGSRGGGGEVEIRDCWRVGRGT